MVKKINNRISRLNTMQQVSQEAQNQGYKILNSKTRKSRKIRRANSKDITIKDARNQGYTILSSRTRKSNKTKTFYISLRSLNTKKSTKRLKNLKKSKKNLQKIIKRSTVQPNIQNITNIQQTNTNSTSLGYGQIPVPNNLPITNNNSKLNKNFSSHYRICLGWITTCDVDASILMFDKNMRLVDYVSYRNLDSSDSACKHSGDDLYGKNKDGDNEVISINMNKLNNKITSIWPVINVYSGFKSFRDINGVYCKILDQDQNIVSRIDLQNNCWDNVSNGCIMSKMTVDSNKLSIKPKGLYTKDTTTCQDMIKTVQQVENNDLSNITIRETQFNI